MIKKILRYFHGYLEIKIKGNALERFLNQIIAREIDLWQVNRVDRNNYSARIYIYDFIKLKSLVKKRMCSVRISKRFGFPFLLQKISRRKFLLVGIILFLLIFYLGSSFLWFIEIEGLNTIKREEINKILLVRGIKTGVLKDRVSTDQLERELLKYEPRITWVNVRWQGTQLYIKIVEKKIVNKTTAGNIYASRDGLIEEIIVLKGIAAVKEGNIVTEGQPLIMATGNERARGIVKAHVWYENTVKLESGYGTTNYTGRSMLYRGIIIGSKIFWLGNHELPYTSYHRKRVIKRLPKWRNLSFPIELINEEYKEIYEVDNKLSKESIIFFAKEKSLFSLLEKINPASIIEDIKFEIKPQKDDSLVELRTLIKVNEDIARFEEK